MISKDDKTCKFGTLERRERMVNLGYFGGKREPFGRETQPTLRFNVTYVDPQCNLSCSAT